MQLCNSKESTFFVDAAKYAIENIRPPRNVTKYWITYKIKNHKKLFIPWSETKWFTLCVSTINSICWYFELQSLLNLDQKKTYCVKILTQLLTSLERAHHVMQGKTQKLLLIWLDIVLQLWVNINNYMSAQELRSTSTGTLD